MPEEAMHDQEKKGLSREGDEEDEDGRRTSCQLYSYQHLEAATCCFSSRNKLGSGGFGTVYKVIVTTYQEYVSRSLISSLLKERLVWNVNNGREKCRAHSRMGRK
jgi:hypothetical protein